MRNLFLTVLIAQLVLIPTASWAQNMNAVCDLNGDGTVNSADLDLAKNMALGTTACPTTINVFGVGVCNVVVVQRVTNASTGGACLPHYVSLTWNGSTGATGYNVYRGTATNGTAPTNPVKITPTPITTTSFTDTTVQGGQTYYYVTTAVNASGESGYSNQASATIPSP